MQLSDKTKAYIVGGVSFVTILVLVYFIGEIVLPFVFALFIAYWVNPVILKIQKKIRNRNLAVTTFLLSLTVLTLGIVFFFGAHIVKDTQRFVSAVEVFVDQNETQIREIREEVSGFVGDIYASEEVQSQIAGADTMTLEGQEENLVSALEGVYSFFSGPSTATDMPTRKAWSWLSMLIYTLMYTVTILYTYGYFEGKYAHYFGGERQVNQTVAGTWRDFKKVFLDYFQQRAKVVLIGMVIFVTAFSLMDLPGAVFIGILTGLLTYAAQFHYLSLPLVGVGCWVLSVENDSSFFLFFGILLGVYIVVSVLEETIFFDKIMKSVSGMNIAVMILAFALWIFLFGGFIGTVLALPMTQLVMVIMDRLLKYREENRNPEASDS